MHGKKIISNSVVSITYRIVIMLLGFLTRKIFIKYLGEEILGLNSFYANLLDLLNLADLGIGVAVQYQLYEPLVKKDNERLSKIITATKKIYNLIGIFILIAGIVLSFFIKYLIKETTCSDALIQSAFIISVIGTSLGYFFVHKKLFLQANENIALVNIIELFAKLMTVIASLYSIVILKSYIVYLVVNALNGLISNLTVNYIFNLKYAHISANSSDVNDEMKKLLSNLKNVIPLKLSNYVYNSTDNLIITKVIGLTTVALYTNYMTIINAVMSIEYLIGNAISASMGKMINEIKNKSKIYEYYQVFEYFQYLLLSFATVAMYILFDTFIKEWLGEEFILDKFTFVLLIIEFYIHSIYQIAYVMYGATGLFEKDRNITIISAVINIVISIVMVNFIGLAGVIIGTLITDIYIFIVRTIQIVKGYFEESYIKYLMKVLKYTLCFFILLGICVFVCDFIKIENGSMGLVIKGVIIFFITFFVNLLCTCRSREFKTSADFILKYLRKD